MWVIRLKGTDTYYSGDVDIDWNEDDLMDYTPLYDAKIYAIQYTGSDKMRLILPPWEEWEEVSDVGH